MFEGQNIALYPSFRPYIQSVLRFTKEQVEFRKLRYIELCKRATAFWALYDFFRNRPRSVNGTPSLFKMFLA